MSNAHQNWFTEIDYLRAIAIIGVLIVHTTDNTATVKKLTGMTFSLVYIEELARFAVPMFIFISGFVLYNKYRSELPVKEFYKKRFMVILIPYLIFSVIYCVVNAHLGLLPTITLSLLINSIFTFKASGHFWYISLILIYYVFYPAITTYYKTIKKSFGNYALPALFSSILILYFLGLLLPPLRFIIFCKPCVYLIYFLFGIYTNDNYKQISHSLERLSLNKVILLSVLIISLPFFCMLFFIDSEFNTQFSQSIPYYLGLRLLSEHILYICIFMLCLHLILLFKPRVLILQKIGEYSYGIYLVHMIFHNFLIDIFPQLSIFPVNLNFYIILFSIMLVASYYTVKLMLTNNFTAYFITGKLQSHY